MGTMGNDKSSAICNAPRLKRPNCPSRERVPSGKITVQTPSLSCFSTSAKLLAEALAWVRSTKICPAALQAMPTKGTLRSSAFINHLKITGSHP